MVRVADLEDEIVVLHKIRSTEVIAFGRPQELDLLGSTTGGIDRPFVDANLLGGQAVSKE
jgi:hypothetical protein